MGYDFAFKSTEVMGAKRPKQHNVDAYKARKIDHMSRNYKTRKFFAPKILGIIASVAKDRFAKYPREMSSNPSDHR